MAPLGLLTQLSQNLAPTRYGFSVSAFRPQGEGKDEEKGREGYQSINKPLSVVSCSNQM
ncbi:unnamed protein product [Tuber melanosporum]|uniref:(Perigord truffle) hypothetical protein n=1 Tax=Tuber melanosporum (strain Mel28) TaxID=656061 RepID=D5GGE4_TUBMM|nr:uncharacterized protein GSTUM_00007340001 [Tuber melanosporum]CAZ83587.1 unnamed protein product [Tuber melanosporum]